MRFSPFNPIRFLASGTSGAGQTEYVRTFAESDCIMLEVFASSGEDFPSLEIIDAEGGETVGEVVLKEYTVNSDERMGFLEKSNFVPGCYFMRLGAYESECVRVLSDDDVAGTALIQYAYRDNRRRDDLLTRIFGGIRYFGLRVHGGFRDSGWTFKVDNEQFTSPMADPVELSAIDYTERTLTIGSPCGVDAATAGLINRILTCPLVFIDGIRYTRSGSSSPERDGGLNDGTAVYSVVLREAHYVNARMEKAIRLNLRRTPESIRRAVQRPRRYI